MTYRARAEIVRELGNTQGAFGLAVYAALCELSAKQKNKPEVTETVNKLGLMVGLSQRKTAATLKALAEVKVISIVSGERPKGSVIQPPNTYVILSTRRHNEQSARQHNKPSADGTRVKRSRAELGKKLPHKGGVDKENAATGADAMGTGGAQACPEQHLGEQEPGTPSPFRGVADWDRS